MQKTYLMVESVARSVFQDRDCWSGRGMMPFSSNPRFFRSDGTVIKSDNGPDVTQIRFWNSIISLTLNQKVGSTPSRKHHFPTLEYAFNILGKLTGGNRSLPSPESVSELFNGIRPTRRLCPREEDSEDGREEALEMLFSFMNKGLFDKLGKRSYTTALEFVEHAIAVYDRRYFDFRHVSRTDGEGLETFSIGNDLVYIYFVVNGTNLVANIVYMGDIELAIAVDVTKIPDTHHATSKHIPSALAEYLAYKLRPSQLLSGLGNKDASVRLKVIEDVGTSAPLQISSLRLTQAIEGDSGLQVCEVWDLKGGDMLHLNSSEGQHSLEVESCHYDLGVGGPMRVELEGGDSIIINDPAIQVAISKRQSDSPPRTLIPIEGDDSRVLCNAPDLQVGDYVRRDLQSGPVDAKILRIDEDFTLHFKGGGCDKSLTRHSQVVILKPSAETALPENAFLRKAEDLKVGDIVCRDALGQDISAEIESIIPGTRTCSVLVNFKGHGQSVFHLDSQVWILKPSEDVGTSAPLKVSELRLKQATEDDSGIETCNAWKLKVGDMLYLYSSEGEHSLFVEKVHYKGGVFRVDLEGGKYIIFHNQMRKVAILKRQAA